MKKETAETMKDYVITNESVAQLIENMYIPEWAVKANIKTALEEQHEYIHFTCYPDENLNDVTIEYTIPAKYFKKIKPEKEEDSYAVVECLNYALGVTPEELDKFITEELIPYDQMISISFIDPWIIEDKQYIGYDENKKHILFFKGKDLDQVVEDYPNAKYVPFTDEMYENFNDLIDLVEANE